MIHEAETEHEMTHLALDDMDTALLSTAEKDASRCPSTTRNPKNRDFLRHTRLQSLGKAFGLFFDWRQEPRKVAIYRSRRVAAFHCLLHMVPLGAAITLLFLRWSHYWIGETSPDATTLQFLAKFHELLMQVSIVEIMLFIIRSEATQGFVPLGALSGAAQATQLSYLWSLDFLSMVSPSVFRERRLHKAGMVIAIPLLLISTALVGPSSAILMIPGPGCPRYLNVAPGTSPTGLIPRSIFASRVGSMDGLSLELGSLNSTLERFFRWSERGFTEVAYDSHLDNNNRLMQFAVSDAPELAAATHAQYSTGALHPDNIVTTRHTATIPMRFADYILTKTLGNATDLRLHNATGSLLFPQPVATATCITMSFIRPLPADGQVLFAQKDGTTTGILGNMTSIIHKMSNRSAPYSQKVHSYAPLWFPSTERDSNDLVVVFMSADLMDPQPPNWLLTGPFREISMKICSLSVHWVVAPALMTNNKDKDSQLSPTRAPPLTELAGREVRNMTLNVTGIDMLVDPRFTAFAYRQTGFYLSTAVALSISNLMDFAGPTSNTSKRGVFDAEGRDWDTWQLIWYSHGYCATSTSIRLSLVVILAYCIITLVYICYIIITGTTSTAWNSAIELVALALQSKKPDVLGRIGVGIDSMETFKQDVGIRVNKDDELELVFASDRDIYSRGLRKIERNKAY